MIVAGVSVDMVDQDRYTELGGCTPEAESANGEKLPAVGEKRRFELTPKPGPVRTRHTRILGRYIGPVKSVTQLHGFCVSGLNFHPPDTRAGQGPTTHGEGSAD